MIKFSSTSKLAFLLFSSLFFTVIFALSAAYSPAEAQLDSRTIECNPSNGSGGLAPGTYADTTIAGQPAIVVVSENYDPATPTFLAFYLHGDGGGYNFYSQDGRPLNNLIRDNGWIFVSPQSFVDSDSGVTRWWGGGVSSNATGNAGIEANAQLLEDVIEDMYSKYNLCQNVLLGHSASGGSWFYDGYFVPTRGDRYPAFMNIACGSSGITNSWAGFPFYSNLLTFNDNASIQNRTQMHYTIGDEDFLFAPAERAIPHYQGRGFNVTTDILPGVEHCDFDLSAKTIEYWTNVNNSITLSNGPVSTSTPSPTPTVAATLTPTATAIPTQTPTPFPAGFLDEFSYLPLAVKE
ncbi:MAG: hypothetical protein AB8G95_29200 [Anaerolineae bacterium]